MRKIVNRRIYIYQKKNGKKPVIEWLRTLDKLTQSRIENRIEQCADGNLGDYKRLKNGISELRLYFGPGYRIYFRESDFAIFLLCGGDKSTQQRDIELAQKYSNDSIKEDFYEI